MYVWTKKSSSNADEKADTANHPATKHGTLTQNTCITLSSSPPSASHLMHTLWCSAVYLFIHLCVFFFSSRTFPSLRHGEYNKVSICGDLRWVGKKGELRYRQLIGHIEIKWLGRWCIVYTHRPSVCDAADLLSKSVCARALHMSRKSRLFCAVSTADR